MMFFGAPGGFGLVEGGLLTLTKITSVSQQAIPDATEEGDMLLTVVWGNLNQSYSPSGWAMIFDNLWVADQTGGRVRVLARIAQEGDAGDLMEVPPSQAVDAGTEWFIVHTLLRANRSLTSVFSGQGKTVGTSTSGNPSARTISSGGGTPPLMAIGLYTSTGTINPRSMSPEKDGETNLGSGRGYLAWKYFLKDPVNVVIDMSDEGNANNLGGAYFRFL